MKSSKKLMRRFWMALIALFVAVIAATAATFAWYVFNISVHTTRVHMAVGTSASLYISSSADGAFTSAAVLDEFTGTLNPVSTNRIQNGFQKAIDFVAGGEGQAPLVANDFGDVQDSNYYKTTLYLKSDGDVLDLYLAGIGFEDSDEDKPISTAIRLGFVVPATGQEYIFAINQGQNPQAEYNTAEGQSGHVLDSLQTNGTTVEFTPFTSDNFAIYNSSDGTVTLTDNSVRLCTVDGTPLALDVYIWLEGCDEDCTGNLCATTLKNLALSFCAANSAAA